MEFELTGTSHNDHLAIPPDSSRVEFAYRSILALITEGALPEGSRLPSEADMAKSFRVSRPVVRQALTRLKESGVVEIRWGAGSYVLDPSGRQHYEPIFGPIQGLNDVRHTYELRFALEGEAAALAARHKAGLDQAWRAFEALEKSVTQRTLGQQEDLAFHMAIARAAQNPYFERVLKIMRRPLEFSVNLTRTLSLTHPIEQLQAVQAEHRLVLEAIAAGDEAAARTAMHQHIDNACRRMFEGPGQK